MRVFRPINYVLRQLGRRRTRYALTVTGISVCVMFFILFVSVSEGMHEFILSEAELHKRGELVISGKVPFPDNQTSEISATINSYCSTKGTEAIIYPIYELTFLSAPYDANGSQQSYTLIGMEPEHGIYFGSENIYEFPMHFGNHLSASGNRGIVLGYEVWNKSYRELVLGEKLVLYPPSGRWIVVNASSYYSSEHEWLEISSISEFELIGVMAKHNTKLDYFAFATLKFLLRALHQYDENRNLYFVPKLNVLIRDGTKINFDVLEQKLVNLAPMSIWDNRDSVGGGKKKYEKIEHAVNGWITVIITMMVIVSIVGISNTLLMSITERKRELGILKAVGLTDRHLFVLLLLETLILCTLAMLIGGLAGASLSWYFNTQYEQKTSLIFFTPTSLNWYVVATALLFNYGVGLVALLYPLRVAKKLTPVEALRYE